jgi:hypothetical protein
VSEAAAPVLCLSCHERLPVRRGLCFRCYDRLRRAIQRGEYTWAELEASGQSRPVQSRKDTMQKWFRLRPEEGQ